MTDIQKADHAKVDPRISCPIMCGEFLRATGFFFAGEEEKYLLTARHNVLPTTSTELATNAVDLSFSTRDFHPTIDVFLQTASGFDVKRLDVRKQSGVRQTAEIDVIGIPIDFEPEAYGYRVWKSEDIISPTDSPEALDLIGFNGDCFPDMNRDYEVNYYRNNIENPAVLQLVNEMPVTDKPSRFGLISVAIDEKLIGSYDGLSGAPVLGDGLVGLHGVNISVPETYFEQFERSEFRLLVYWRADLLPKLLL